MSFRPQDLKFSYTPLEVEQLGKQIEEEYRRVLDSVKDQNAACLYETTETQLTIEPFIIRLNVWP